jgi:MFS family permease
MLLAAIVLGLSLLDFALVMSLSNSVPADTDLSSIALLLTWTALGAAYSAVMTPSGRLLRRSAQPADRPAVFAAQFALSHACWLLTYPLAGWLGSSIGMVPTLLALAALTFVGVVLAFKLWQAGDSDVVPHEHPELPPTHPHLRGEQTGHAHAYMIDELHHHWP